MNFCVGKYTYYMPKTNTENKKKTNTRIKTKAKTNAKQRILSCALGDWGAGKSI